MHFDHDFGVLSSLLTIDTTVQPLQGGTINMLDVVGSGGIKIPVGDTTSRIGVTGVIRFNSDIGGVECYNGTEWTVVRDNGSVTLTVDQPNHGFALWQLVTYDAVNDAFYLATQLHNVAGIVSKVIDVNRFIITLYGLISDLPAATGGEIQFWSRDITTGAIVGKEVDTADADSRRQMLSAAREQCVPIVVPVQKYSSVPLRVSGCFIPASTMFVRPYFTVRYEQPAPTLPRLLDTLNDVAAPTSPNTLARYVTIQSLSTYEMPSWYNSLAVDLTAIIYDSRDIMMNVIENEMASPPGTSSQPDGAVGYLSTAGAISFTPPASGIKQVVGFVMSGEFKYIAPYVEQATAGSVYISNSAPSVSPGIPYLWVQTGLNTDGKGITFWVEDGL